MNLNVKHILTIIAIILAVVSMIWPNHIVLAAAVVILAAANLVP